MLEPAFLQEMTGQILQMQALHYQHNGTADLVVETRQESVFVPLSGFLPDGLRPDGSVWRGTIAQVR